MFSIKDLKAEQKGYQALKKKLEAMKAKIENEELPFPIDQAEAQKLNAAIEMIAELCHQSSMALESSIDDLSNDN